MKLVHIICSVLILLGVYLTFYPTSVSALSYDLIAPSGTLNRGDTVQFIINIDSQGTSLTKAQVGMTYENQFLQYVNTTPGDAMTSIEAVPTDSKTLMLTGSNSAGFNGSGVFAYVSFKIIAEAPGTSELCALFAPNVTPTAAAGTTPTPTTPVAVPTQLPQTGTVENGHYGTIIGTVLLLTSLGSLAVLKRSRAVYSGKKH